ncbi:restriction endonuclease subunit S [Porifericola rhodea]|uniref:restriction endonuclease subunit S n=1 Tax=Porifericola rhodea TaxID=930972 RepID=UPI002665C6A6|nr:restriction endonuclease subunit S [Porifericola rhodea]WKN29755.1 restriction endonuclease subunit S [Porifericola rhodea]
MKVKIGDIAHLQFGFYAKPEEAGEVAYLQVKHFDKLGKVSSEMDAFIPMNKKNESHLLQNEDILFVGKGLRNFAWTYHSSIGPAIASSIFFVIKADKAKVLPEYLTTLFNLPQSQAYFQTLGAGSSIPSIRKSELEAFTINLPPLEVQEKAVAIKLLHEQDIELSHKIIAEKEKVYQSVIHQLIQHSYD